MNRVRPLVFILLTGTLPGWVVNGDDPPKKLTAAERKGLEAKWQELNKVGFKAYQARKYPEASKSYDEGLQVARRLYNESDFPDGHNNLAASLSSLAAAYQNQGKLAAAEPLFKEALEMRRRLLPGDHPDVAMSLGFLAALYHDQGKLAAAEPLFEDALAMRKRLFPGDHPEVLKSMNNLALLYKDEGKLAAAEPLYRDVLAMRQRLFPGDHPTVAVSLNNLADLYKAQGKLAAAESLFKDTLAMYKRLFPGDHPAVALSLNNLALLYHTQGKLAAAEPLYMEALAIRKRLFPRDHLDVAVSQNNLAGLYLDQGKLAAAEPLYTDALAMYKRLVPGDHPYLAKNLNNLAALYKFQGKLAAAEPLYKDALAMRKRLYPVDHPDVAQNMNNLAFLYQHQDKLGDAEPLIKEALEMRQRLFKGDHPDVVQSLDSLAGLYRVQGKLEAAELLSKDALAMCKRLFPGDHPDVATSSIYLAHLYQAQGNLAEAEPLLKDALAMGKRLFPGDHPRVALSLSDLAVLYQSQGKVTDAEPLYKDALAMYRRLTIAFAQDKTEGETLTLLAQQPLTRDAFLSCGLAHQAAAANVYPELWAGKGHVARAYECRQLQSRAAATDSKAALLLADLIDARRRRTELLVAPAPKDPASHDQRDGEIKTYEARIAARTRDLKSLLPVLDRINALAAAQPSALQQVLPSDAAVVDYLRFVRFEWEKDESGRKGVTHTVHYLAFVVMKDKVAWLDLGAAASIEPAVLAWREAITGDPVRKLPPASMERATELGRKVRALVWEKVRQELPAGIMTLYFCPDAALCKVPFAALPGDEPGTILLENFAVALIPHAPFLLEKLSPRDPLRNTHAGALVVGAVKYDAEEISPAAVSGAANRGDGPLLKPGQELGWGFLHNTAGEANGVVAAAERKKITATHLAGDRATTTAVLAALPKTKFAHFATHGFFADESFRGIFQLDEMDYEKGVRGERV